MQVPKKKKKKKIRPVDEQGRRRPSLIFLVIASPQKLLDGFKWNLPIVFAYRKQFWSVDKFGRLVPVLDLVKFPIDSLVIASPPRPLVVFLFRSWSQCSSQCLVVQVPVEKMAIFHFSYYRILRNYVLQMWKIRASPSQNWRIRTYLSHLWKIRTNSSQVWQIRSNFSHLWQIRMTFTFERICHMCEEFARICHTCKKTERIIHMCDKYVQILHTSKIRHLWKTRTY